ncbi:conserved hypothetical protein [Tenacibaculum litopenaei]|uniref:hypothetical protein n=1 Tax=Tenacibaculum litopenaei TaxID=396016 RepID=UPI003895201F
MMDSKEVFYKVILDYYVGKTKANNVQNYLNELAEYLSLYFFKQYKEYRRLYPKSKKRYSTFNTKDLENPLTHDLIINFFKERFNENYRNYSSKILGINNDEFLKYEKNRNDFYDMW